MQKLILLFVLFLASNVTFSQQQYFVYIQSDNKQPFYVLLKGKTYSSSEFGHVILSKLGDSTYSVSIGFPQKAFPEQIFSIPVNKKDAGYQLKNMGDKGWALFNFQTLHLIMSGSTAALEKKSPDFYGAKKTDGFSVLLATVVNDSSILYHSTFAEQKPIQKPQQKTEAIAELKRDSLAVVSLPSDTMVKKAVVTTKAPSPPVQPPSVNEIVSTPNAMPAVVAPVIAPASLPAKESPVTKQNEVAAKVDSIISKKNEVVKLKEVSSAENLLITFISRFDLQTDTITINIPIEKIEEKPAVVTTTVAIKDSIEKKIEPSGNFPLISPNIPATATVKQDSEQVKKTIKPPPVNNCKNYATESDVDKLRVKIMAAKSNAEKIEAAKKVYKAKCFSVRQIKALSELYKTDEARFQFFEASYPSVSDAYNFSELGSFLTEETYRNKFNEL